MKDEILSNLDNPGQLERLYRTDKQTFRRAFKTLYPEIQDSPLAGFWHARLNLAQEEISWGSAKDLTYVIGASILVAFIAKLPVMFDLNTDFFFSRNIGFIVFPVLSAYFAWKNKLSVATIAFMAVVMLAALVFINTLPDQKGSDTLVLSCIHLVLFLWAILGFAFVGSKGNNVEKRLGYLKYNGDLVVMTTLILISGGIMTGLTINLFSLIGFQIEKFYFEYIVISGLSAAPIVGTYLTQTNPQLVGKVSPVIARIFSPLVLVMLATYLVAIIYARKDPYNDREFLLIFNGLLVGVMAIIFFSIAETSRTAKSRLTTGILFSLSVLTIIVNGIALSAILFRISEWGVTPNRAAVLGGNVLILINLLLVTWQLFRVLSKKTSITEVGKTIAYYLPVYILWSIIVVFLFPLIFGFR
ncbi:hypothetical protein DYBT9275_02205 [Dyadobacter sp. CECT 9275]|uniref:DUF4153 domain-containing protein n=1 Tax=Dyadobacter helix TaxID=2822344 RepID=A0A916JAW3_9BACT|nr:hypothetical protein [Dyadobacter sp. CECT 9275]CAG4999338.1 hypothetical protein DYBT9275_02205 [Dyadobacter sp. CECT 9275]